MSCPLRTGSQWRICKNGSEQDTENGVSHNLDKNQVVEISKTGLSDWTISSEEQRHLSDQVLKASALS